MDLLDCFRCDPVCVALRLLFVLAVVGVGVWGIVGAIRLLVAWARGGPAQIRPRRVLIAAAVVLMPWCLFKLATWHPELSESSLRGLTSAEVIDRVGLPDGSKQSGAVPPGDFRFSYRHRGLKCYFVVFRNDRVVQVVSFYSDK